MKSNSIGEQAATWASEANRKRDKRRQKLATFKSDLGMLWHRVYWKVLWTLRLGRPYSIAMCKAGLYRKYSDGRCHWSGVCH